MLWRNSVPGWRLKKIPLQARSRSVKNIAVLRISVSQAPGNSSADVFQGPFSGNFFQSPDRHGVSQSTIS